VSPSLVKRPSSTPSTQDIASCYGTDAPASRSIPVVWQNTRVDALIADQAGDKGQNRFHERTGLAPDLSTVDWSDKPCEEIGVPGGWWRDACNEWGKVASPTMIYI